MKIIRPLFVLLFSLLMTGCFHSKTVLIPENLLVNSDRLFEVHTSLILKNNEEDRFLVYSHNGKSIHIYDLEKLKKDEHDSGAEYLIYGFSNEGVSHYVLVSESGESFIPFWLDRTGEISLVSEKYGHQVSTWVELKNAVINVYRSKEKIRYTLAETEPQTIKEVLGYAHIPEYYTIRTVEEIKSEEILFYIDGVRLLMVTAKEIDKKNKSVLIHEKNKNSSKWVSVSDLVGRRYGDKKKYTLLHEISISDNSKYYPTVRVISKNGRFLAVVNDHKAIELWNLQTRTLIHRLLGSNDIKTLSFSADGLVLAGGDGNEVRLWNTKTGKLMSTLSFENYDKEYGVPKIRFSPDGRQLAIGRLNLIHMWNVDRLMWDGAIDNRSSVYALEYAPDSKTLATGNHDGVVQLWDTLTYDNLLQLKTGHGEVENISYSPDGQLLASGGNGSAMLGDDRTVKLWDLKSRTLKQNMGQLKGTKSIMFLPSGKSIVIGTTEGVYIRDAETGKLIKKLNNHTIYNKHKISYLPNQNILAGTEYGLVKLWNVKNMELKQTLNTYSDYLIFTPNDYLITANGNKIEIWQPPVIADNLNTKSSSRLGSPMKKTSELIKRLFPNEVEVISDP